MNDKELNQIKDRQYQIYKMASNIKDSSAKKKDNISSQGSSY